MGIEIERTFRVHGAPWADAPGTPMVQGYLAERDGVVVRVRRAGDRATLTVKGPPTGHARIEVEAAIPLDEAAQLLALCGGRVVRKTRHLVPHADHTWEVDVFEGAHAGLVLAEVELGAQDERFAAPPWLGPEVSDDRRSTNAWLAGHPGVPDFDSPA